MTEAFDRGEFIAGYLAEVDEHLANANGQLLKLEAALAKREPQLRMVRELFRALHTIKGLSAMVGVEPIVELAHEMETLLRVRDQTSSPLSAARSSCCSRACARSASACARSASASRSSPRRTTCSPRCTAWWATRAAARCTRGPTLSLGLGARPKAHAERPRAAGAGTGRGQQACRIDFAPSPANARGRAVHHHRARAPESARRDRQGGPALAAQDASRRPAGWSSRCWCWRARQRARAAGRGGALPAERADRHRAGGRRRAAPSTTAATAPTASSATSRSCRSTTPSASRSAASTTRSRSWRRWSSRASDSSARCARCATRGVDVRALETILGEHRRELSRLRARSRARAWSPMQQLLERVPLLVRGMARDSGRQVELRIDASRAELDKAVAERVFPALVHLVRNAVDHAIEPRRRARAPRQAAARAWSRCAASSAPTISSSSASATTARHRRARVARKAGVPLPDDERGLLALITRPGLLDARRRQRAQRPRHGHGHRQAHRRRRAGGELSMRTELGAGTTFTLRLPISISILDTFTFRCGAQSFVVPLAMVEEVVELERSTGVQRAGPRRLARSAQLLRRKGETIPLFELASFFCADAGRGPAQRAGRVARGRALRVHGRPHARPARGGGAAARGSAGQGARRHRHHRSRRRPAHAGARPVGAVTRALAPSHAGYTASRRRTKVRR